MAHVLIIEDDGYHIFMLKKALAADGHKVCTYSPNSHTSTLVHMLAAGRIDLVLINRFLIRGNGWDIFNQLKERDHEINVMLYVLQDCNLAAVKCLGTSVKEALMCKDKKRRRPAGLSHTHYPNESPLCPTLAMTPDISSGNLSNI